MEESEFKKLYAAHAKRLYNFILWTTARKSVCDDLLQTVFLKIWQCDSVPQPENERIAWLYTVAHNTCIDYFRSNSRFASITDTAAPAENPAIIDDGHEAWREAARLPFNERAVVYLHIRMGYSYAEIGRRIGMSEGNARITAFRALRKLRESMERKNRVSS
jgi:RNA polymerase sigma-70 factor, ECF subfamily